MLDQKIGKEEWWRTCSGSGLFPLVLRAHRSAQPHVQALPGRLPLMELHEAFPQMPCCFWLLPHSKYLSTELRCLVLCSVV